MANIVESQLVALMMRNGASRDEAERCAPEVVRYGAVGAAVGAAIGYKTMNPATLLLALVTGTGAGTVAGLASPSCSDVRNAVQRALLGDFGR